MHKSLLHSLLFVGLVGGCMGSAQFGATADVTPPDLVVISPGVQVIANYDEPIFFSDNYYWRNDGGAWYRSTNHSGGWARVEVAPVAIRSIERPAAYIHYHGQARAQGQVERHDERREERHDERREERRDDQREHKDEHKDKHEHEHEHDRR